MYLESSGTEPGKSSGDRVAYACTMSSAAGSLAGKKVVVYHTVEGGSFNAYAPHLSMAGEPNPSGYLPGNLKRVNNLALLGGAGKCAAGAAGTTSVTLERRGLSTSAATIAVPTRYQDLQHLCERRCLWSSRPKLSRWRLFRYRVRDQQAEPGISSRSSARSAERWRPTSAKPLAWR